MSDFRTKEVLAKHNLRAKKKFGQNFISDTNLINKLVRFSNIDCETTVLEIGAGLGILTAALSAQAKEVIAFEIDSDLVTILKERFARETNIVIIPEDFLGFDLTDYFLKLKPKKLAVCANLPYYISTPILFKLLDCGLAIENIAVMLQNEVAERFTAKVNDKDYSAITIIASYKYEAKIVMKVPKEIFYPQPQVDSAVVLFTRKTALPLKEEAEFFRLIKSCFKYRRKTIYNNYREFVGEQAAKELLKRAGIQETQRAQELSLSDYLRLFEVQSENKSLR